MAVKSICWIRTALHCGERARKAIFQKRVSRVCQQRAAQRVGSVSVYLCVRPAAKNIREYARCGRCVSTYLCICASMYLYLYPITRVGAQKYTSCCLEKKGASASASASPASNVLRPLAAPVRYALRQRLSTSSPVNVVHSCLCWAAAAASARAAALGFDYGQANARLSRLIGFLAFGLGFTAHTHTHTRTLAREHAAGKTEPGPAQLANTLVSRCLAS